MTNDDIQTQNHAEQPNLPDPYLQFYSSLVQSLAWPITTLIILLVFRSVLIRFAHTIIHAIGGSREIHIGMDGLKLTREIEELATKAEHVLPTNTVEFRPDHTQTVISYSDPTLMILESWRNVLLAAQEAVKPYASGSTLALSPSRLGNLLQKRGILSSDQIEVFYKLRNIRNSVAHATGVPIQTDSAEYAEIAAKLIAEIKSKST